MVVGSPIYISTTNLSSCGGGEGEGEDLSVLVGARRNIPEELLQRARELRRQQTSAEKMLWECLRGNRLFGFKFRRQHNIGQYIADFYCHAAKLVIELDGEIHQAQTDRDSDRDSWLEANGLTVLRFKNKEITQNLVINLFPTLTLSHSTLTMST